MDGLFEVIHEDSEFLVINKPAGLVCHPTKTDEYSSLIGRVRLYLGKDAHPHLVNRLDRETSGVVLVALQDASARRIRKIWESRGVEKEYLAMVHGHLAVDEGVVDQPLGKDLTSRVAIRDCVRPDGLAAQTGYQVLRRFHLAAPGSQEPLPCSLLRVRPRTGRKHQIRIHLAHLGHPIVGDKIYGPDEGIYLAFVESRLTPDQERQLIFPNHALHAAAVRFPWHTGQVEFLASPAGPMWRECAEA
jgi:23S rRNA pseudouridine1911/1915/1917 synthase